MHCLQARNLLGIGLRVLDIIRKKASSWIIKFLLGLVAFVFILYFGTTTLRRNKQEGHDYAALVNNDPITTKELRGRLQQLKETRSAYQNLPANLEPMLESSLLQGLIEEKVITSAAKKMGLKIEDEEVAHVIRLNKGLANNGKFDELEYRERFRPGFFNRYGFDYEEWVKNVLLIEKLRKIFAQAVFVSDTHLKNRYALDHMGTKLNWAEFEKTKKIEREKAQKEIAEMAFNQWAKEKMDQARIKIKDKSASQPQ